MNKRHRNQMEQADPAAIGSTTKVGWRINEWAEAVGVCRGTTYNLLDGGSIDSVKVGAARVITTSPADFIASLRSAT